MAEFLYAGSVNPENAPPDLIIPNDREYLFYGGGTWEIWRYSSTRPADRRWIKLAAISAGGGNGGTTFVLPLDVLRGAPSIVNTSLRFPNQGGGQTDLNLLSALLNLAGSGGQVLRRNSANDNLEFGTVSAGTTGTVVSAHNPSASDTEIKGLDLDGSDYKIAPAEDTVGLDELSATGTPSATKYLRGDNTWETPPDTDTGTVVEANPTGTDGGDLTRLSIAGTNYNLATTVDLSSYQVDRLSFFVADADLARFDAVDVGDSLTIGPSGSTQTVEVLARWRATNIATVLYPSSGTDPSGASASVENSSSESIGTISNAETDAADIDTAGDYLWADDVAAAGGIVFSAIAEASKQLSRQQVIDLLVGDTGGSVNFTREGSGETSNLRATLRDDSVDTAQIADDAVETDQIADDAVGTAQLADNAVGNTQMADNAVGTDELSAGGTPSATTFLRGDNTWAAPAGSSSLASAAPQTNGYSSTAIGDGATGQIIDVDGTGFTTGAIFLARDTTNNEHVTIKAGSYLVSVRATPDATSSERFEPALALHNATTLDVTTTDPIALLTGAYYRGDDGQRRHIYVGPVYLTADTDLSLFAYQYESDETPQQTGESGTFDDIELTFTPIGGTPGVDGSDGGQWYTDTSAPAMTSGYNTGDMWLIQGDVAANGDVYRFDGSAWNKTGSILGGDGEDGDPGARGSLWYSGAGAPGTINGAAANDQYLNTTNGDIYQYDGSSWSMTANLTGDAGTRGGRWAISSTADPSATTGYINGDAWMNTSSSEVFSFNGTAWVSGGTLRGTDVAAHTPAAADTELSGLDIGGTDYKIVPADNTVDNDAMADDAVGVEELSATGTPSATTFLRGDNTWSETGGNVIAPESLDLGNATNVADDGTRMRLTFRDADLTAGTILVGNAAGGTANARQTVELREGTYLVELSATLSPDEVRGHPVLQIDTVNVGDSTDTNTFTSDTTYARSTDAPVAPLVLKLTVDIDHNADIGFFVRNWQAGNGGGQDTGGQFDLNGVSLKFMPIGGVAGRDGTDGDPGPPGSGSTVIVQEEGTQVGSAAVGTLNFVGEGITASESGGVATITLGDVGGTSVDWLFPDGSSGQARGDASSANFGYYAFVTETEAETYVKSLDVESGHQVGYFYVAANNSTVNYTMATFTNDTMGWAKSPETATGSAKNETIYSNAFYASFVSTTTGDFTYNGMLHEDQQAYPVTATHTFTQSGVNEEMIASPLDFEVRVREDDYILIKYDVDAVTNLDSPIFAINTVAGGTIYAEGADNIVAGGGYYTLRFTADADRDDLRLVVLGRRSGGTGELTNLSIERVTLFPQGSESAAAAAEISERYLEDRFDALSSEIAAVDDRVDDHLDDFNSAGIGALFTEDADDNKVVHLPPVALPQKSYSLEGQLKQYWNEGEGPIPGVSSTNDITGMDEMPDGRIVLMDDIHALLRFYDGQSWENTAAEGSTTPEWFGLAVTADGHVHALSQDQRRYMTYDGTSWTRSAQAPSGATGMYSCAVDDDENLLTLDAATRKVYTYNTLTNTWSGTSRTAAPTGAGHLYHCVFKEGKVWCLDGTDRKFYVYDLENDSWDASGPSAPASASLVWDCKLAPDGDIIAWSHSSSTFWRYDGEWHEAEFQRPHTATQTVYGFHPMSDGSFKMVCPGFGTTTEWHIFTWSARIEDPGYVPRYRPGQTFKKDSFLHHEGVLYQKLTDTDGASSQPNIGSTTDYKGIGAESIMVPDLDTHWLGDSAVVTIASGDEDASTVVTTDVPDISGVENGHVVIVEADVTLGADQVGNVVLSVLRGATGSETYLALNQTLIAGRHFYFFRIIDPAGQTTNDLRLYANNTAATTDSGTIQIMGAWHLDGPMDDVAEDVFDTFLQILEERVKDLRDTTAFQGTWSNGADYEPGQVVIAGSQDPRLYMRLTPMPAVRTGQGPRGDTENWIAITDWYDDWRDVYFPAGALVKDDGGVYICIVSASSGDTRPRDNTTNWMRIDNVTATWATLIGVLPNDKFPSISTGYSGTSPFIQFGGQKSDNSYNRVTLPNARNDSIHGYRGGLFSATDKERLDNLHTATAVATWAQQGNTDRFPASKMGSGTADSDAFLRGDRSWIKIARSRGAYSSGATYRFGDTVVDSGNVYFKISTGSSLGVTPSTNPTTWRRLDDIDLDALATMFNDTTDDNERIDYENLKNTPTVTMEPLVGSNLPPNAALILTVGSRSVRQWGDGTYWAGNWAGIDPSFAPQGSQDPNFRAYRGALTIHDDALWVKHEDGTLVEEPLEVPNGTWTRLVNIIANPVGNLGAARASESKENGYIDIADNRLWIKETGLGSVAPGAGWRNLAWAGDDPLFWKREIHGVDGNDISNNRQFRRIRSGAAQNDGGFMRHNAIPAGTLVWLYDNAGDRYIGSAFEWPGTIPGIGSQSATVGGARVKMSTWPLADSEPTDLTVYLARLSSSAEADELMIRGLPNSITAVRFRWLA